MTTDTGGVAFPCEDFVHVNRDGSQQHHPFQGMTLLDYFAGEALAGILANPKSGNLGFSQFTEEAYQYAICMIAEKRRLEKASG